jgi:Ca2+-binding EF-hand superfamily protein
MKMFTLFQDIFRCMDTDGSGTVSLKELLEFLKAVSGDIDAREVSKIMQFFWQG